MGFFTTFIIITILAYFSHRWYHKYGLKKGHTAWIAYYSILVCGGLLLLDILIYLGVFDFVFPLLNNLPWVNIDNGKDFMWNSFQLLGIDFGINYNDPGLTSIAVLLFISYPSWYIISKFQSRMIWGGHKKYEEGLWWAIGPTKAPKKEEFTAKPQETK